MRLYKLFHINNLDVTVDQVLVYVFIASWRAAAADLTVFSCHRDSCVRLPARMFFYPGFFGCCRELLICFCWQKVKQVWRFARDARQVLTVDGWICLWQIVVRQLLKILY